MSRRKATADEVVLRRSMAVCRIAEHYDWEYIGADDSVKMISFRNGDRRINIYLTTMTVATVLKHPTKGKTQLFRKDVSLYVLEKLFANPRTHTGRGYYHK